MAIHFSKIGIETLFLSPALSFLYLNFTEYNRLLETNASADHPEWQELIRVLTVHETYFFRDPGQMDALRRHLLPELIRRNERTRTLRIWSAGCSTGEEPYTLAILLDQLLPERSSWNVFLLGTDLDADSLETAREGIYGDWSFRAVAPDILNAYFRRRGGRWEVRSEIRQMITFQRGNLIRDAVPDYARRTFDFDLIVYRNVLIYFDPSVIPSVVLKFGNALKDGGYLLTGHAEIMGQNLGSLRQKILSSTTVYRKFSRTETPTPQENPVAAPPKPRRSRAETRVPAASAPIHAIAKKPAENESEALLRRRRSPSSLTRSPFGRRRAS